jgi:hypothetical protein
MTTITFADVKSGTQLASAAVDGSTVTYDDDGDLAKPIVEQYATDHHLTPAAAVRRLAAQGWSNGYIMVDLPGLDDEPAPTGLAEVAITEPGHLQAL